MRHQPAHVVSTRNIFRWEVLNRFSPFVFPRYLVLRLADLFRPRVFLRIHRTRQGNGLTIHRAGHLARPIQTFSDTSIHSMLSLRSKVSMQRLEKSSLSTDEWRRALPAAASGSAA
jgi:hypothetical protein